MGFSLSPTVTVREFDQTLTVPSLATSIAGVVGHFQWGPVDEVTLVDGEASLVKIFGKPDSTHYGDWFTAANFLAYASDLRCVRASKNITKTTAANDLTMSAANDTFVSAASFFATDFAVGDQFSVTGTTSNNGLYTVKTVTPTTLTVVENTIVDEAAGEGTFEVGEFNSTSQTIAIPITGAVLTQAGSITNKPLHIKNRDDFDQIATHTALAAFYGRFPGALGNSMLVSAFNGARNEQVGQSPATQHWDAWAYKQHFDYAPTDKEIWIIVIINGEVVEKFLGSQDSASVGPLGGTDYFVELLNRTSKYIWAVPPATGTGLSHQNNGAATLPYSGLLTAGYEITPVQFTQTLLKGSNSQPTMATYTNAWSLFADPESQDVNFLCQGGGGSAVGKYIAENIAAVRLDCIACVSPNEADVVGDPAPSTSIVALRAAGGDFATSTSYAFIDGNYKQQYDKYNDVYRWIPFNGDIAGLMAYTDDVRDPWWSPAGFNRGQIKNVFKVAFNPTKAMRDELYKNGINPISQFRGQGTVLYGDKTALTRPSAFSRINVRRLFITIEKAIATAAQYSLFEFNDAVTRGAFVNLVEPYLRLVQGRRGINDFRVVCDETNNTGEVIDRNEFVADIYVKPAYSINEVQLNFTAVKTGVAFEEIILNPTP